MLLTAITFLAGEAGEGGFFWTLLNNTLAARWFNLLVFIGLMVFLLRKPVANLFAERKNSIRRDLIQAQEQRNAAMAKLQEVEARLANLNTETETVRANANAESQAERQRLAEQTEQEIERMRAMAQREIESASKAAKLDLRRFAAEQSVALAEQLVRREIRPEDDRRLLGDYVNDLRGARNN